MTSLDAVTDELYAGDPAGFVARRDALAKEARARKDRELAAAIKALRRPSVGAWYLNVAARSRLTALVEYLGLVREVQAAQASGDAKAVVALSGRRAALERRVLSDLTAHLRALGIEAGAAPLEEVRTTLRAALTDPDAAVAIASGRLEKALEYGGVGFFPVAATPAETEPDPDDQSGEPDPDDQGQPEVDVEAAPGDDPTGDADETPAADAAGTQAEGDDDPDGELAELERAEAEAEAELRAVQERLAAASAKRRALAARRSLQAARDRVAGAEAALTAAEGRRDDALAELAEAEAAVTAADAALGEARASLAALEAEAVGH